MAMDGEGRTVEEPVETFTQYRARRRSERQADRDVVVTLLSRHGLQVRLSGTSALIWVLVSGTPDVDAASVVADILNEHGWSARVLYNPHELTIEKLARVASGTAAVEIEQDPFYA
jgi:hypothetical protein